MENHEVADIFPLMSESEFGSLCTDIREHGLRDPIWTYEGKIIDGRNRFNACTQTGIEPRFREYDGEVTNLVSFVVSLNLHRRHLSESQRAMVAAKIANLHNGQRASSIDEAVTQSDAAQLLNVSKSSVERAAKVQKNGVTELVEKVEAGDISVSQAAKIAELPKGKQMRLIKKGRKSGQKVLTDLKISTLKKVKANDSVCLLCSSDELADEKSVSAHMQLLARKYPKFSRYFLAVVDEIEESDLSDTTVTAREKIFDAIESGYQTQSDIQKRTGLAANILDHTLAVMLDYKQIIAVSQGGKTDGARGARKTLYIINQDNPTDAFEEDEKQYDRDFGDHAFAGFDVDETRAAYPA